MDELLGERLLGHHARADLVDADRAVHPVGVAHEVLERLGHLGPEPRQQGLGRPPEVEGPPDAARREPVHGRRAAGLDVGGVGEQPEALVVGNPGDHGGEVGLEEDLAVVVAEVTAAVSTSVSDEPSATPSGPRPSPSASPSRTASSSAAAAAEVSHGPAPKNGRNQAIPSTAARSEPPSAAAPSSAWRMGLESMRDGSGGGSWVSSGSVRNTDGCGSVHQAAARSAQRRAAVSVRQAE